MSKPQCDYFFVPENPLNKVRCTKEAKFIQVGGVSYNTTSCEDHVRNFEIEIGSKAKFVSIP